MDNKNNTDATIKKLSKTLIIQKTFFYGSLVFSGYSIINWLMSLFVSSLPTIFITNPALITTTLILSLGVSALLFLLTKQTNQKINEQAAILNQTSSPQEAAIMKHELMLKKEQSGGMILIIIGWLLIGLYLFTVVNTRLTMGAQDWNAIGSLSIITNAPLLVAGVVALFIGSGKRRLKNRL